MRLPVENVQSYPRPPRVEPVDQIVRIVFSGQEITRSKAALRVLETHHAPTYYIPLSNFAANVLYPVNRSSYCEWKGHATYFDVVTAGHRAKSAAWTYPQPTQSFEQLVDHVAIYAEPMDACFVGDVQVTPQPGNFYGGWVTPNLLSTIKGIPGTEGW